MKTQSPSSTVRCRFTRCDETTVLVVMATVDQLCAVTAISLALLESLEVPLGEAMSSLQRFGIVSVAVRIEDDRLHVVVDLAEAAPPTSAALFPDDVGLVEAFFDVRTDGSDSRIELVGSLG